jgi:4-carboxymuconolactone decarboxylase
MGDSTRRERGRAIRRRLMGDAYADKIDSTIYNDPIMAKFA